MTFFFGMLTGMLLMIGTSFIVTLDDNDDHLYRNSDHNYDD